MSTTALAKNTSKKVETYLRGMEVKFTEALAGAIDYGQYIHLCLSAMRKSPKLMKCTPESIVGAMFTAATLGMNPNLQECYFVPYKDEASFQISYKGLLKLVKQSGLVRKVMSFRVYQGEHFSVIGGTNPRIDHTIDWNPQGEPIAYYAIIEFTNGGTEFAVMSREQVKAHRDRFSKSYNFAEQKGWHNSTWHTDFDPMADKTVLIKLTSKQVLSPELVLASQRDDRSGMEAVPELIVANDVPGDMVDAASAYFEDIKGEDINRGNAATQAVMEAAGQKMTTQ